MRGKNPAPAVIAVLPYELPMPPRSLVERGYNLTDWNELGVGGHFAAMEQPKMMAAEIRRFFRRFS